MHTLQMTMNPVECGLEKHTLTACEWEPGGGRKGTDDAGKNEKNHEIKHKREKVHWLTIKTCQEPRSIINSILCT